jgi:hypothetical protein
MNKFLKIAILPAGLLLIGQMAYAQSVTLGFPSSISEITSPSSPGQNGPLGAGGGGFLFEAGDRLDQLFTATGLATADSSHWVFSMSNFTSNSTNTFDVAINDTVVGSYSFVSGDGNPISFDLNYTHTGLVTGPDYKLSIIATSTVAPGFGSWNWIPGGEVTLTSAVPEPATFAVLGLGALALVRRKKKA